MCFDVVLICNSKMVTDGGIFQEMPEMWAVYVSVFAF